MAKMKEELNNPQKDLNSAKPLQVLSTNSAKAPFKGGIGKAYIAPQSNPKYYEANEALFKGTIFKELDDDFKIEEE